MPRPNRSAEKRAEMLPLIAACFAERGYRRSTTADLAKACGVQETILYRLWPGKKEMFLAAIEHVYTSSTEIWSEVAGQAGGGASVAEQLLRYESEHLGEFGRYRIIFAGLSETDDPDIRRALHQMFDRFRGEIASRIAEHREGDLQYAIDADQAAWAFLGLGMLANLSRDLGLFGDDDRSALLARAGRLLLEGNVDD